MNKIFNTVGGSAPRRSSFDLSYEHLLTCDMGQLIPVQVDEAVPGDIWKMGVEAVIRMNPLVAPILHEMKVFFHTFFVPYRLLWDDWEDFISGGEDGDDSSTPPAWAVTDHAVGSLYDYMGFPTGFVATDAEPLDFPKRAYNLIWNEFYRDETLQDEVDITTSEDILSRSWMKDYFTSALPWTQRGTAPALPLSGTTNAAFQGTMASGSAGTYDLQVLGTTSEVIYANDSTGRNNLIGALDDNVIDFADAATFDVNDLRLAFQIQRWMELNARGGVRYTEYLKTHYGVSNGDARLQRPEWIGGTNSPIIVSEVLQTSQTDTTPQGTLTGHGIGVNEGFLGTYRVKEFGVIMTLMSIMPAPLYQQGIDRQWLRRTRYDFFNPHFVNLGEQGIERAEIYATSVGSENTTIFGYCGRYDEMRVKRNRVSSKMATDFDHWHISRQFASAPLLNDSFIECVPRKDFLAAPSEPAFIVNVGNKITAVRPLPFIAVPGMIDHAG